MTTPKELLPLLPPEVLFPGLLVGNTELAKRGGGGEREIRDQIGEEENRLNRLVTIVLREIEKKGRKGEK